jgi:hypothetical protein
MKWISNPLNSMSFYLRLWPLLSAFTTIISTLTLLELGLLKKPKSICKAVAAIFMATGKDYWG